MGHKRPLGLGYTSNRKSGIDGSSYPDYSRFCHPEPAKKDRIRPDQLVWWNPGRTSGRVSSVDEGACRLRNGRSQGRKLGALPRVRRIGLVMKKKTKTKTTKKKTRRKRRTQAPAMPTAQEKRRKMRICPRPQRIDR